VPFWLCEHHNDLFLPWHRGYLYHFELGLQDIDPEVTVPWWNWMDEPDLPAAFNEPEVDGEPNVLFDAPVEPYGLERQPGWPERTFRQPGAPHTPKPLGPPLRGTTFPSQSQDAYDWMMSATSYSEFESRCWRVHDNIHDWVGGTMADQNWAAYDPIFWAHHAMVDRLWRIWQHNNPAAAPPNLDHAMSFARAPALKVHEVLDVKQLGYEYAGQADTVEGTVPSG
jgi:tyrosinase